MSFNFMRLAPQIADTLTTALAHFLWQGTVLSLMLFVVVRLLNVKSIQTRYLLSVATLVMMGVAPLLTIAWYRLDLDPANAIGTVDLPLTVVPHSFAGRRAEMEEMRLVLDFFRQPDIQLTAISIWMGGVLILSMRLFVGFSITLWIRARVTPVSSQLEEMSIRLCERLGMKSGQRVFSSRRVGQAVAVGFFRPVVLLPVAWLTQLTPEILEAVIAHELAHIRRWDLWVNLFQRLIETFLFYHPAVWWLSRRIRLEREMCCDEMAANCLDRAVYVRSLESVAQIARGNLLLATSIHGDARMKLLNRVRHVLGMAQVEKGNWGAAGFVAMILPLTAIAAFSVAAGSAASLAIAEEGKSIEANEAEIKVGDSVVIRMSGDLAKECYRLIAPNKTFAPGEAVPPIDWNGPVTSLTPDGRCKIEGTSPAHRVGSTPQLFTMTVDIERSQIKTTPPRKNGHVELMVSEQKGKDAVPIKAVVKQNEDKTLKIPRGSSVLKVDVDAATGKSTYTAIVSSTPGLLVELSSIKGVEMKLWELKNQAGK